MCDIIIMPYIHVKRNPAPTKGFPPIVATTIGNKGRVIFIKKKKAYPFTNSTAASNSKHPYLFAYRMKKLQCKAILKIQKISVVTFFYNSLFASIFFWMYSFLIQPSSLISGSTQNIVGFEIQFAQAGRGPTSLTTFKFRLIKIDNLSSNPEWAENKRMCDVVAFFLSNGQFSIITNSSLAK